MYYVIYALMFCLSLLELNVKINQKNIYIISCIVLIGLILFAGFRGEVGTDYREYIRFWENLNPISSFNAFYYPNFEIGYKVLFSTLKFFTDSNIVFLIVNAFFALVPLFLGLKRVLDRYYFFALLIYYSIFFIPYDLNGMRQAIAMSFFIFALPYFFEKKYFKVLIITFLAALMHSSGMLIAVSYIFYIIAKKIEKWFYPISFVLALFVYKSGFGGLFLFKYLKVNEDVYNDSFDQSTSSFQILMRTVFVVFLMYFSIINENKDKRILHLFNVYWFGYLLYLIFLDNNMISTRFNMYFRVLEVVLVPMIVSCYAMRFNKNSLFYSFIIPCFIIFYVTSTFSDNIYTFIWE